MTSPPRPIDVICPDCQIPFTGYYRPSINLGLGEEWTEEEIEEATTVQCPGCKKRFSPGSLIVESIRPVRQSRSRKAPNSDQI